MKLDIWDCSQGGQGPLEGLSKLKKIIKVNLNIIIDILKCFISTEMLKIYNQYKLKYFLNTSPFLPTVPEISETTKWIVVNSFMNTPSFCDQKAGKQVALS